MPSWYRNVVFSWFYSYDDIISVVLALLYGQVFLGIIGSLGAACTGVVLSNLAVALFGIVAIASGYQSLGRAYVAFLACGIVLDALWITFFSQKLRNLPHDSTLDQWDRLSMQLTLFSECSALAVRCISSLLWCQICRLGSTISLETESLFHITEFNENSLAENSRGSGTGSGSAHSASETRNASLRDEVLGATIYEPDMYALLLKEGNQEDYFNSEKFIGTSAEKN